MPTVDITNGDHVLVQVGSTVQLKTATTGSVTTYNWTPALGLSCADCPNPVSAAKNDMTYTVTVSNEGKCIATDKIVINMVCNNETVFLPNTFSPNGDGMNDAFYPRGNGLYNIKSFKIFNRWGQIIYDKAGMSANSPKDGWNGKFNGIDQPTDVYVYIMEVQCVNNAIFPFKGNITLLR
jgi:gliding motility-associated-like protein